MLEAYLIKILMYYKNYNIYRSFIDTSSLEPETRRIITILDKCYESTDKESTSDITRDRLYLKLQAEYPSMKAEELETYDIIINQAISLDVDINEDFNILKSIFKKNYINKLYQYLMQGLIEPEKVEFAIIENLIEEYNNLVQGSNEEDIELTDIETIMEEGEGDTTGYKWPTLELQEALGNIKGGDLGKVVATPESGKTAFTLTVGINVARQGGIVVHWNNEERKTKVQKRAFEVACSKNAREFKQDYAKYNKLYRDVTGDRFILKDSSFITIADIKKSILQYNPDLVVIDQSAKIKVADKGRVDLTLGSIDEELRNLCKKYNVHIMGVSQADATAFNKDYITMNCINGSNISVQGELDYMIGINWKSGINDDPNLRYISTPKNKIGQSPESKFILYLDRDTNTYKSLDEIE